MRISEAKECIKELYLNTNTVTALISERGIGKTSAYQQCSDELGIGYIGLYAAALEGPDFMGLPDKDREKGITKYLAPQFLPTEQAVNDGIYPQKGILVLEEINRVPSDTVSVLYPLLLEKRINGHNIAKGWQIGVTMNPDTMNYLVNALDDAMLDRFISMEVNADLDDYVEYSQNNHPNDDILSYLKAFPDMLLVTKKSADSTALLKAPTPRGWTKVQELLNNCNLPSVLMRELIAGIVGPQASASLYGYLENQRIFVPAVKDILFKYETEREKVIELVKINRFDMLQQLIKAVIKETHLTQEECKNLDLMLKDLPEELQVVFFKWVSTSRDADLDKFIEGTSVFDNISDRLVDVLVG